MRANKARHPGRDPGPATSHHPTPTPPGQTSSSRLTRPPPPPYHSTLTRQPGQGLPPAHIHGIPGPLFTQAQGKWHHPHQAKDSSGSAGRTRSSGSCESGPRQSAPSRAWSTGPARGRWRTAASSRRGGGCHRPHGKPCWPMRSTPRESTHATSPRPETTRMSSGARERPSRRREEKAGACGTSPQARPRAHTPPRHPASVGAQTLAAPTASREPRAPHSTTRLTPRPAAPPANPATLPATAAECHAGPRRQETKRTGSRWTPTRTPTSTATPNGAEPKPATVETA